MFGINPSGLNSFEMTPRLPKGWDKMALRHIKAFGEDFYIEVSRSNQQIMVNIQKQNKTVFSKKINDGDSVSVSF